MLQDDTYPNIDISCEIEGLKLFFRTKCSCCLKYHSLEYLGVTAKNCMASSRRWVQLNGLVYTLYRNE